MPTVGQHPDKILRFGRFELDRHNFELRRGGKVVRIEKSPLELLIVLAERAGSLVSQEEAAELVWGKDVHIEIGSALYTAVKKIRRALGDTSRKPKYLETVPRKGYRFIARCASSAPRDDEASKPERLMLAVLPLENMSGDEAQEYFSDGMTEELITELGSLSTPELGVLARTSVMGYKRTRKSIREIGSELGVDYLIEGSVRRDAGRVRIAVQLIRADDQTHVWATSIEKPAREVLRIQAEVAQAVAHEIRIRIASKVRRPRDVDPELYDTYLRGRFLQSQLVPPALMKAIECFQQVLGQSQNHAPSWAALADCYVRLPITSDARPREAFPKAKEAAERSLALDASQGEAYAVRSAVRFWYEWDWNAAEADTFAAQARNPSLAEAYQWRAHLHSNLGRHEEALAEIAEAKRLDPFSRIISTLHGEFYYHAGPNHYRESESLLRYATLIDPHFWVAHIHLSKIWGMQEKYGKATAAAEKAYRYSHGNTEATAVGGWSLAKGGKNNEARKKLKELELRAKKLYVPPVHRALIHGGLGQSGAALDALDEAVAERDVRLTFLLVEARWDPLRSEPRFRKIMAKLNLPPK
ncbi:MAG: winged helix-turn-helix domain-containing tetratricopeptide repeat protein [Candidatus Acidiferrales bacterium]